MTPALLAAPNHLPLRRRCTAAALTAPVAVAIAAGCAGCGAGSAEAWQKSADVTVSGQSRTSHTVFCRQVDWLMTINVVGDSWHVGAVLRLDTEKPELQSVNIDDFNGFTGIADTETRESTATFARGTYHLAGTAEQVNVVNPAEPNVADFTVDVTC